MNLLEITMAGLGTIEALLLLLLKADPTSSEFIEAQVNEYMNKLNGKVKNRKDVKEMLTWILDDKFRKETFDLGFKNRNMSLYMSELNQLKDRMIAFYIQSMDDSFVSNSELNRPCNIHSTISGYVLQLMRLRMVIEPEINLLTNPHIINSSTGERTLYLTAKAFWMEDDGKKVRKFTKSLGLMSDYPEGRESVAAMKEGVSRLQPILWDEYKATYL